jgi:hypothetical protein
MDLRALVNPLGLTLTEETELALRVTYKNAQTYQVC